MQSLAPKEVINLKHGKKYEENIKLVDSAKLYDVEEAFDVVVKTNKPNLKQAYKKSYRKTSFGDYEEEKMSNNDNWSDPYRDEQAYYDGWSREDVESGLADAYENDLSAQDPW